MHYRWVERMNVADAGLAEFPNVDECFLPEDRIPETLLPILSLMAEDYMPELLSIVRAVDDWLETQPEVPAGAPFPASTQGMGKMAPIGHHRVPLRGVEIELAIQHYALFMLGRVHAEYDALDADARARVDGILAATGLAPLIETRSKRRIERVGYTEVLA